MLQGTADNRPPTPCAPLPPLQPPRQGLLELNLVPEEWGGTTPMVPISAKKGTGVEDLLSALVLMAEEKECVANPAKPAAGTVIEAHLDRKRGAVATLLVQVRRGWGFGWGCGCGGGGAASDAQSMRAPCHARTACSLVPAPSKSRPPNLLDRRRARCAWATSS